MGNILLFPRSAWVSHKTTKPVRTRRKADPKTGAEPHMTREREAEIDRLAELVVNRTKRRIAEWQAQQGLPSEEAMLLARLEVLSSRPEGLETLTLYRLDALLKFAEWEDDHA